MNQPNHARVRAMLVVSLLSGCLSRTFVPRDGARDAAVDGAEGDVSLATDAVVDSTASNADSAADAVVDANVAIDSAVETGADGALDAHDATALEAAADTASPPRSDGGDASSGDASLVPSLRGLCDAGVPCAAGQFCSAGVCTEEYSLHAGNGLQCLKVRDQLTCWGRSPNGSSPPRTNEWEPTTLRAFPAAGAVLGMSSFSYSTDFVYGAERSVGYIGFRHVFGERAVPSSPSTTFVENPIAIANTANTLELARGALSAVRCAITMDRAVRCWGCNEVGSLGGSRAGSVCETDENNTRPITTMFSAPVAQVVVARSYEFGGDRAATVCALLQTGAVKCWGINNYGQFGVGRVDSATTMSPRAIDASDVPGRFAAIASIESSICGVTQSGSVLCWGNRGHFETTGVDGEGRNPTAILRADGTPLGNVDFLRCAGSGCCALERGTRDLWCWGYGSSGVVPGMTASARHAATLLAPSGLARGSIEDVSIGTSYCALGREDGGVRRRVVCWGRNDTGEAGARSSVTPVGYTLVPISAAGF